MPPPGLIWRMFRQVHGKSCSDPFFKDMVTSKNIFVINGNANLATLTVAEAKEKAKAAGQPGVVAIFQGKVNENWDGDVKWDVFDNDKAWARMDNRNFAHAAQARTSPRAHPARFCSLHHQITRLDRMPSESCAAMLHAALSHEHRCFITLRFIRRSQHGPEQGSQLI